MLLLAITSLVLLVMLLVLLARAVLSWIVTMVGPSAAGPVRVATRFDKLAVRHEAVVHITAINESL